MPELAEVETIARQLREGTSDSPGIIGKRIEGLVFHWEKTLANPTANNAELFTQPKEVINVSRAGKYLRIDLVDQIVIFIHLRMSGDLKVYPPNTPSKFNHIRAEIHFSDGCRLLFNDPRKFGRIWVTQNPDEIISHLGVDPFDPNLTPEWFHHMVHNKARQIKPLLLDQSFLAGIGNIYSDESLHLAKIHPLRISSSLSTSETGTLLKAIREVLTEGIRRNGSSIDWVYRGGEYQNQFRVYGRVGKPCPVCGTSIARILVGQRGTHFCPQCQLLEVGNEM